MDCVFCKIIKGEISNYTVYEDSHALAFLDIHPRAKGHTMVIPKVHAENLLDLGDELVGHLMFAVKKAMERIDAIVKPDGFNVGWNHGAAGGQEVFHLHIHIFPRWEGDGGGNTHSIIKNPGKMSVEEVFKLFETYG